ncbi:MAG: 30S ribosomal protein S20 [Candidatus Omnitrophica bacterium]|nr:30S ribosomal protein S20 [Candidatus Omnitrophota bacterium]
MPITKSAIDHVRSDKRKQARNQKVRSELRTLFKKIALLATQDSAKAKEEAQSLISKFDRAAQKGAIHKQKANRKKSRLARLLAKTSKTSS